MGRNPHCVTLPKQEEEARTLTLLDDHSRAVLGLLQKVPAPVPVINPRAPQLGPLHRFASDLTNRPAKVCPFSPTFATSLAAHAGCWYCRYVLFSQLYWM